MGGRQIAFRHDQSLASGGRQQNREGKLRAQQLHPRIDIRYVHQHPRIEPQAVERLAIPAQRDLICGAARDPLPRAMRDARVRQRFEIEERKEFFHAVLGSRQSRRERRGQSREDGGAPCHHLGDPRRSAHAMPSGPLPVSRCPVTFSVFKSSMAMRLSPATQTYARDPSFAIRIPSGVLPTSMR